MKRFIGIPFVFATLALLAVSCSSEQDMSGGPAAGEQATLLLKLRTPGDFAAPTSRSLTFAQENAISAVHVLVFDKDAELVDIKQGEDVSSTPGSADPNMSGSGSFSVTLAASKTTADTYNLVVLANAQSIVSALGDPQSITDKSYAAVTASLHGQITGAMYPSGGEIPMWGETGDIVVEPGSASATLQLRRAVARIDVGVGAASYNSTTHAWSWNGLDADDQEIPFELAHVYILRPNDRYAVVPDRLKVTEPTVPAGTTAFTVVDSKTKFAFAASNGCVTQSVYVPEADIIMGSADRKPGDANHNNRMAVIVGGYYDDSATETFYRLDFAQGGNLINVMRNRLYRFSISKAAGAGYADVETAYTSLAMNMTANILDWDVTDMGGVVFDGQYALSVSRTAVGLYEVAYTAASADNKLNIRTDWPAGWTVESITDDATHTAAAWLSLAAADKTGADKTVSLLLTANAGAPRSATIRIAAGRMATEVAVTQGYAPALAHTSNDLPANIPLAGGTYTINVSTNLQDWGVKVYEGINPTPIVTKAANPSPAINRNAAPVASSTTVTVPTGSNYSLIFTVYAADKGEIQIGSIMQGSLGNPGGYGDVLYFAANGMLSTGRWYTMTATEKNNLAYFKFGSVIGFTNVNGTWADAYATDELKFNTTGATNYNTWANIPAYTSADATAGKTNVSLITGTYAYHTGANVKLGKGDPCRLVGLTGVQIQGMTAEQIDAHKSGWRLPTLDENEAFTEQIAANNISYTEHWKTVDGFNGGMFPNTTSGSMDTFIFAAGYRDYASGGQIHKNTEGYYWSSIPYDGTFACRLRFASSFINMVMSSTYYNYAFTARCVRQ